jgi:hypothetical protein
VSGRIIPSFQGIRPTWNDRWVLHEGDCLRDNIFPMKESNYRPQLKESSRSCWKLRWVYKLSLSKSTNNFDYSKKTSNIPVDNGSSLNIPITMKIIALTNITLIETSVLLLYLLLYYLIFNRIQAMVPLTAPLFGVIFLRGHISLKNWT